MIFIFTHKREQMVQELVPDLPFKWSNVVLIEDGVQYSRNDMFRLAARSTQMPVNTTLEESVFRHFQFEHQGKPGFWRLWGYVLSLAEKANQKTGDNFFCFLPDDYTNIDWDLIFSTHHSLNQQGPFVCSVVNDGRGPQWSAGQHRPLDDHLELIGWQDCGFFCNAAALSSLDWSIAPIPQWRFNRPFVSSGVGEQLTRRFNLAGIPMLRPYKSFAFHGEHESVMHPEERKRNPLTSK